VTGQPVADFSGLLRTLRKEAQLTQEGLAEESTISLRTIQDLEGRRHRTAHKSTAEKLGDALGLTGHVRALFVKAAAGRGAAAEVLAARAVSMQAADPGAAISGRAMPELVPRELPADVSAFTGRTSELAELGRLLPAVTRSDEAPGPVVISAVSGTAGAGKTALVVHWAHQVTAYFPDGQLFINLRGYDPEQPVRSADALAGFLAALGLASQDIPLTLAARASRYRSLLAGRRLLLVLDNAADEEQVRPLLPGSPSVLVLVTSRAALPGLVARDGARRLDLDLLPVGDSVTLLRTLIGDRVDADSAAARVLVGLCARLPLALRVAAELAAARPEWPLAAVTAELIGERDRFELLDAGGDPRGAVASVLSWSYRSLGREVARMFRVLGLHPALDWDRHAAAALAATTLSQAGQLLAALSRAHMIQRAGGGRYGMHDLMRAYAADLAARDRDTSDREALTRLFDYYLAACSAAMDCLLPAERHHRPDPPVVEAPLPGFDDRDAARSWLDAELTTLIAVSSQAASRGWPEHAIRLAQTLHRYFDGVNDTAGLTICRHALDAARECDDRAAQARTLTTMGVMYGRQGQYAQATECHEQAVALAKDIGDRLTQGWALGNLGLIHDQQGRYAQAARCHRQTLPLHRELGDVTGEAIALSNLGLIYLRQSRYQPAARHMQQAIDLYRQVGHRFGEAIALTNLGEVRYRQGRYEQAADDQDQALVLSREIGSRRVEAWALTRLGKVRCRQGQHQLAIGSYQQALEMFDEVGDRDGEAEALNGTAETLLVAGQYDQAREFYSAALALTRHAGDRHEQARALIGLGEISRRVGHNDPARRHYQDALALYREVGDPGGEAETLNGLGEILFAIGVPGQALACHDSALNLAQRIGERYQQARAHQGLANAYAAIGDDNLGREHQRQAAALFADLGLSGTGGRD
jgi:tetratricopeptide (TPR) repeat protein/transcriptional regulator with XRE-family HTH domain